LFWDKSKLLQHAQIIVALPLLDYLGVLEAVDGDALELKLSASGRAKLLRLSLVGTAYGVAAYHLLTLAYHIFDTDVDVGEGRKECGGELLGLLVASDILIRLVPDEIGGVDLFYEVGVPLVDDLPRTPCQGLVLFSGPGSSPFQPTSLMRAICSHHKQDATLRHPTHPPNGLSLYAR
jgi:hypothetical protein